ncbi:hypothetical protein HPB49_013635 [Dermacentor silvarum]|uniref:Uncharacterized protein n=1 Tax=Dermacentor silvarum TaxID=543639 RepID=A0ACB8CLD9_DERSI|nr:hypothetical protein HPB49_013635 [Dermacentor silvarum]
MAALSRAIIVQPAASCVPSTTPGGEELMDVASAAVSVTDESKRQARTPRALPASAAAMQEARRQNAREEIHDSKRRRMESEQLEDDAAIRKAASHQAEWSSHDPEEGFEGDGLWERATTRSRRQATQREQENSTRPARVVERIELGCFILAIRPRERRSIVSLNAREVKQAISALSHDKRLAQHQLLRFNDASNTLTVQTCDERQASDLLKLNTLEIPSAPPLPVSVHQVPSEGMPRDVIYGYTPDETSETLAEALDSENVQILQARPMGKSGSHEEPPESCPQTDKKYCLNCEKDGHLATDASCPQRKLFAKHAKAAQGHQSRSAIQTGKNVKSSSQSKDLSKGRSGSQEIAKELEQIDVETEVSTRDFESTLSRLQKQLSEIQRFIDTARTRFYQQLKERNEQKLWKEERTLIDQAKRRQSLSPRRGSAPPPKNTRPHTMNGGKLKNPQEPSKEETGRSVEVVPQAYRVPEWITQFLNDTRAQWNCRSLNQCAAELNALFEHVGRPAVLLLQETRGTTPGIRGYEGYFQPSILHAQTGKKKCDQQREEQVEAQAAVFVRRDVPHAKLDTAKYCSKIQEVVAKPVATRKVVRRNLISNIYPKDRLLVGGDFNAPHQSWGYDRNSGRGCILIEEVEAAGIILANDLDYPTRHALHSAQRDSTPDLTWTTPGLVNDWRCGADPMGSDHYPIWIEVEAKATGQKKRMTSAVDWT